MEPCSIRGFLKPYEESREYVDARIKAGIEQNRKSRGKIRVLDQDGQPVVGAHLRFVQKSHDFKLGANIFMLDEMESEEKNAEYKRLFADTFNLATVPFYWNSLEPEQGKPRFAADSPKIYRRPAPDLCLDFCEKHGITPKAHCLNYDGWSVPAWMPRDSVQAVKEALERRFEQLAERYRSRIPGWEVTNETLCACTDNHTPFFYEDDFISWSFETARRYFPRNELIINEAPSKIFWEVTGEMPDNMRRRFVGNRSIYFMQIERELRNGTPIDAIGFQYHMFMRREAMARDAHTFCDPVYMYRLLDKYATFGKPLQITETTLSAFGSLPEDEEIQAQLLTMLYSVWFSHPAMEAIIYWNLVDGYAVGAQPGDMTSGENYYHGGLVRFDMTPKPAFLALKDLFEKQWRTQGEAETDGEGCAHIRGFHGQYDVEVVGDGRTTHAQIHLSRDGTNRFTVIV